MSTITPGYRYYAIIDDNFPRYRPSSTCAVFKNLGIRAIETSVCAIVLKNATHCFATGADGQEMLIEAARKKPVPWDKSHVEFKDGRIIKNSSM